MLQAIVFQACSHIMQWKHIECLIKDKASATSVKTKRDLLEPITSHVSEITQAIILTVKILHLCIIQRKHLLPHFKNQIMSVHSFVPVKQVNLCKQYSFKLEKYRIYALHTWRDSHT